MYGREDPHHHHQYQHHHQQQQQQQHHQRRRSEWGLAKLRLSQPPGQTSQGHQNVRVARTAVYLGALVALERSQGAVSEFNVEDGDVAAVADSSTGQPVALLLLQRRHLATVPTTRTVS